MISIDYEKKDFLQLNLPQSWVQLPSISSDKIIQSIIDREEMWEGIDATIENANRILKKYKWFISLNLPFSFFGEVLKIEKSGANKRKRINRLFIEYFTTKNYQALEKMVETWKNNPHFNSRMKIFRICVKTLKRAKRDENPSIVVIPVLIAQIDGIMREIITKYNLKLDPITKMWIDGKGNQTKNKNGAEKDAKRKLIESLNEDSQLGEYLYFDILFQRSIPELCIPTTFTRNKILHGKCINYGRMDNTIRAFLILDYLDYLGEIK